LSANQHQYLVLSEWILIQQRVTTTFNWNLTWSSYKAGFGSPDSDYWLGLETMHQLTTSGSYQLRLELQQLSTGDWYVDEYSSFTVGDEATSKYQLNVAGHSGNGTDSLLDDTGCVSNVRHNGMKFTTSDQDNDLAGGNCASYTGGGGWWHNACLCVCPTCYTSRGYAYSLGSLQVSRMLIALG
jgi:ficolin